MIRVPPKPEYPLFDEKVRKRGQAFLATTPMPNAAQFKRNNYWTKALKELHAAYNGVCAYTAMYLPDRGSVDHFLPKSSFPELAYEWSNYRLANARVNSTKGNSEEVIDPFEVEDDWFHLDIPSCLIRANGALDRNTRTRINSTINTLRLNSDDSYVQERCNILMALAEGHVTLEFLELRYPFVAKEVTRQGILPQLAEIFRVP